MKKRKITDSIIKGLIWVSSFITVGILAWILLYVIINGIGEINWEFLTTAPVGEEGGIFPMIITTVYMVLLTVVISTPIGIFAAVYLVEYAKPGKVVRIIRFATESLAGIPSIIYGLFGFIFFVTKLEMSWCILAGALTLSIMVLPTIVRTTEEALKAVPNSYREGSLALGTSKLRTIRLVVLPSALPGILAAVILSIGRVVGETAAVIFTAGMGRDIPTSLFESGRTLSVHLYFLAKEGLSFEKAYATATILIIIILLINFTTNKLAAKFDKTKA
ncbi:phosphate ABC transporter permease PstA [Caldisalinibacter kiritimatiensis]|uniref:Phosphate transport system permease protein PstA n=1 Tax=Caldisalinibacter kiritimatiensis TaxID=1304284 RepID=R1AXU0_9FIRM|nr:phosphate ABC transporter permease PstA [Caldisalinibacter kiritimatiensis]EOD01472.1 Phosphate transport system permease protein PstA [Caldisalinibacter kiritimatiensis]